MFKKVVSLCLSAAVAMSLGVVVGAEVPKEEYDFDSQDCRSICAMRDNFNGLLDREVEITNLLKERFVSNLKEDLKAAAGLARNENVGEFAAKRVIKPVNKVFTEALLELQARIDKFNEVKNKLDEVVGEKCICPDDVTDL